MSKSDVNSRPISNEEARYHFELYMIGTNPSSSRAVVAIRKLCEDHLAGRYLLKVIDVSQHRHLAKSQQIIAAPTLIVKEPGPERRFIGDLSDSGRLKAMLCLA